MSVSTNGIAFINPLYNAFAYGRRAAMSFFKHTPEELNPICITVDDCSPLYAKQDWDYWLEPLPADRHIFQHFEKNSGLTRSWNWGLKKARELGCRYVIAGNSDILFTPGWYEGLIWNLDHGTQLVGPVTNAPGWSNRNSQRQNVRNYYPGYKVNDDPEYLSQVASHVKEKYPIDQVVNIDINGFFTVSTLDQWWKGAFDKNHVFNPGHKLTGNEDELQKRWLKKGWKIGFVPSSFVFHYRAVSRGDRHKHTGWSRLNDLYKDV